MNFTKEMFSEKSQEYASARPRYPAALFLWLAQQCNRRDAAWDCATGNGQAAVGLSPYFEKVYATDISAEQILYRIRRENIEYSIQSAEHTGFPEHFFDLIVVAQALHWFDYSQFWQEVSRVARYGALFCAWGYDWLSSIPDVDRALVVPFREIIAPFWASNNMLLWNGYRNEDIAFPFQRIDTPSFSLELEWSLGQLVAYMMTWSAFKHSRSDAGAVSSMDQLLSSTRELVSPDQVIPICMPLKMVAGRVLSQ